MEHLIIFLIFPIASNWKSTLKIPNSVQQLLKKKNFSVFQGGFKFSEVTAFFEEQARYVYPIQSNYYLDKWNNTFIRQPPDLFKSQYLWQVYSKVILFHGFRFEKSCEYIN